MISKLKTLRHQSGEINTNALMLIGVTIGALFLAVILGDRVARGDYKPIAGLFVISVSAFIAFSLGKNYWVLIPLSYPLVGSIGILPIPFSYSELGVIGAGAIFVIHLALHKQHLGFRFGKLDWLIVLNLLLLLQAYIRNPAGMLMASSEIIGSRQYFTIILAFGAYLIMSHASANFKIVKWMVWVFAIPLILAGAIDAVTSLFPGISKFVYPFYSAVNIEGLVEGGSADSADKRITGLADVARPLILLLCSLRPPLTFLMPANPLLFGLFLLALLMIGLSGFRSILISATGHMAVASVLWRRKQDIAIMGAIALVGLFALTGLQVSGYQIPLPIQRTMSFIPFVEWDASAVAAADDSTQWRVDMWKEALASDRYIRNKFWGDGLGFRLEDFLAIQRAVLGWGGAFSQAQSNEAAMIKGSFHSGPLSTVRVVGAVGMLVMLLTIFSFAIKAYQLAKASYGTPFFPWCLFMTIPIIYMPFQFIFIFGDYKNDIVTLIMTAGYFKFFETLFSAWKASRAPSPSANPTPDDPLKLPHR
jgi:hypothetical protein